MSKLKKLFASLSFRIFSFILVLLLLVSIVISAIGLISFTNSFKKEYSNTSYHMAASAAALVNADRLNDYLNKGIDDEYLKTQEYLDAYCYQMNVSLVYVIVVDENDYLRFVSVFNSVNNTVDNTSYSPWELGHRRKTTNDEYRLKYELLYTGQSEYETVFRTKNLKGVNPHITTMVPLTSSTGKVTGLLCLQRPISELNNATKPYLIIISISIVLIGALAFVITIAYLKRQFVKPLRKISSEAERFALENSKGEKLGVISRIQEISNLAHSIDKMEDDMLNYIDNLTNVTIEKERIGAELSIASNIQENSIPHTFPAFPDRSDFDIYASMRPAKEVGGDFYNFFLVDNDHLALVIADVSGKGVPAALFMMVTNILITDRTKMGGTPGEILTFVNYGICEHNEADMFVTVWLGIVELSTGKVVASNAGHDAPAIYQKDKGFKLINGRHGLAIGAISGYKYTDYEFKLDYGDKLFLYTDGVTEATNIESKLFGFDRMINSLNNYKDLSTCEILNSMKKDIDEFVGEAPQFDDLTMVCFELKEKKQNLIIEAKDENLYKVLEFIDGYLEQNDCAIKAQTQIDLSVEEIFINICHYAYLDKVGECEIDLSLDGRVVSITFKDSGIPFDPLKKADPDTTLSVNERKIGGLGIFMVKKNMDDVKYEYLDSHNILTLIKNID